MKKKNKQLDKWFLLTWRKAWIIVVGWFLAIMLHNVFYAIFGFEEFVFLIITILIIPLYFIICVVYSLVKKVKHK